MFRNLGLYVKLCAIALLLLLCGFATWMTTAQHFKLISDPEGVIYQRAPSASTSMATTKQQGNQSDATAAVPAGNTKTVDVDLVPVRIIRDTYPNYSAVGVDNHSEEVFLQDENLFGIKVYGRLDNTPRQASFTEPKRVLGGPKTKLEYNCALYVDPNNGDIYSLSNDTVDTLAVFPRDAKGDVAPMRELATPQATFGFAVDEENKEIFMAVQQSSSVVVYRKEASGKEPPLRELVGDNTKLADPHGIAVDPKKNLMFVNDAGATYSWDHARKAIPGTGRFSPPSIKVFPLKASGDTPPLRTIQGPKTGLNWAAGMSLDAEHEELFVANDGAHSILVFRETDDGDVAPVRVLKGPRTGLKHPTGVFFDSKSQELWVANFGNHSATVYPRTANGDVSPLRTIRGAPFGQESAAFANPSAVGYDTKRDQILVAN